MGREGWLWKVGVRIQVLRGQPCRAEEGKEIRFPCAAGSGPSPHLPRWETRERPEAGLGTVREPTAQGGLNLLSLWPSFQPLFELCRPVLRIVLGNFLLHFPSLDVRRGVRA